MAKDKIEWGIKCAEVVCWSHCFAFAFAFCCCRLLNKYVIVWVRWGDKKDGKDGWMDGWKDSWMVGKKGERTVGKKAGKIDDRRGQDRVQEGGDKTAR